MIRIMKMGMVRAQMSQEGRGEGRARSERRVIRGPEFSAGGAMRVRWWRGGRGRRE